MEGDPEALRIAANVVKDETKKWKKLCDMMNYYAETSGCIQYSDISLVPEEGNGEIGFQNGEIVSRLSPTEEASDGELVTRDILNDEPVEGPDDTEIDGYSEVEGDTDGDAKVIIEASQVTDGPVTSEYVDIQEDISDQDAKTRELFDSPQVIYPEKTDKESLA